MGDEYRRNNTSHSHTADPSLLYKKELDIKINHEYLGSDNFIVGDLRVDSQRHIMFSTEEQLDILRQSNRWFMDGTFKVVDKPFRNGQLMTIHGFVKSDDVMKQVPLLYVLMSSRRKDDYVAVLRKTIELLGHHIVEGFVLDFEAGWHNRLNGDCGQRALPFYKLVPALRKQTRSAEIDIQELVDHGVGRQQRLETRRSDKKIFELWDQYTDKQISATSLLRRLSRIYGPAEYTV